jgi:predicted MPP superfamily phosphohydrolase
MNRRRFLKWGFATTTAAALGVAGYTFAIEPYWVEVITRPLPVKSLPSELKGKTLMQISDLHVGRRVQDDYLLYCLELIRGLAPDILVMTGDFISYDNRQQIDQLALVMRNLPLGALATFATLGNHDYGHGWSHPEVAAQVVRVLEQAGARVLRNEVADVRGLKIAGLDDLWGDRFDPLAVFSKHDLAEASIVLVHNPDGVDHAAFEAYTVWILAGHTHGGQCKPPFLPPPLLPVRNKRYTAGEIAVDTQGLRRLYINRGLGHLLPVRFNVRPEITEFVLDSA